MAEALWFRPVCDDLMVKIVRWYVFYERGDVFSTRQFMDSHGSLIDKPQKRAYKLAIKPLELEHLMLILRSLAPENLLTKDLAFVHESMQSRFRNFPLANRPTFLVTGEWLVQLAYYQADVKEIIEILTEAKTGRSQSLAAVAEKQKQAGKELFEL